MGFVARVTNGIAATQLSQLVQKVISLSIHISHAHFLKDIFDKKYQLRNEIKDNFMKSHFESWFEIKIPFVKFFDRMEDG